MRGSQGGGGRRAWPCGKVAATHITPREEPSKQQDSLKREGTGSNGTEALAARSPNRSLGPNLPNSQLPFHHSRDQPFCI